MDQSRLKAIVDRNLRPLVKLLGISHWHIEVHYDPGPDDEVGRCDRLLDYERATITLDSAKIADESEALKVLRHELFHIVLSPFDILHCWMMAGLEGADQERADRVWRHAQEIGVKNLERLWAEAGPSTGKPKSNKVRPNRKPNGNSKGKSQGKSR